MPRITVGTENNAPIEIHYEDHGSGDLAARLQAQLDDSTLVAIEGGPHNIAWTHSDEVNRALLEFIQTPAVAGNAR